MNDFYEIDFLDVGSKRSGDAIALRYRVSGQQLIHVVDGGYQSTGDALVDHIRRYYGDPQFIDHVVVTHNDGDHAGGLRSLFESFRIGALWMLRPWLYAGEIIHLFSRYRSVGNLEQRLRELYPAIGVGLPGIDVFQVPHHGSRRNVSTEVLDRLLGPRQWSPVVNTNFSAVISAAKDDPQHPRKAVVRACHHRGSGGRTFSTENWSICLYKNSPYFANRGWGPVQPLAYPETQEA